MFGPTFASPSYELRERLEIATPAPTSHGTDGEWKDRFATILQLGCIAVVAGLTICVFFGLALYFLARPTVEVTAVSGARDHWGAALTRWVLAGSEPAGNARSLQATQPDTAGQRVPLAVAAPVSLAEPRPVQIHQNPEPKRGESASTDIVSGPATAARDAMTWVVGGQILHLWGIRPDFRTQSASLAGLVARVSAEGSITCHRQAHSKRYRCSTATREDLAETELLSGIGRAADGATTAYRSAEAQARSKGRWLSAAP